MSKNLDNSRVVQDSNWIIQSKHTSGQIDPATRRAHYYLVPSDVPFRFDVVSSRMNANSLAVPARNMSRNLVRYV
jgi:hypothetical protein